MNPMRPILWGLGLALVLVGIYLLYFETQLSHWVSLTVLTAGVIVFVGLAIMSFSGEARDDTTHVRTERIYDERHNDVDRDADYRVDDDRDRRHHRVHGVRHH